MKEEKIIQIFRFKKMDEARNYFLEEIKNNYLVSEKPKKVCKALNYN